MGQKWPFSRFSAIFPPFALWGQNPFFGHFFPFQAGGLKWVLYRAIGLAKRGMLQLTLRAGQRKRGKQPVGGVAQHVCRCHQRPIQVSQTAARKLLPCMRRESMSHLLLCSGLRFRYLGVHSWKPFLGAYS